MKLQRLFLTLLFSAFVLVSFTGKAGSVDTVTSSEFFTIELFTDTQSPWTKNIPITLKFRANRDSEKTGITWDSPTGVRIIEKHPQFVSVTKGEVYTYSAVATPESPGTYNIAVNVTAWEVKTNYTSSSNITLKFDENLVRDPAGPDYGTAELIKNIILVLLGIVVLGAATYGVKLGFGRLKEWLKPPE
jgi:hypothetical protein